MEESQLEQKVNKKTKKWLTIGGIGLCASLGVGYSILSNDTNTGSYITHLINYGKGLFILTGIVAAVAMPAIILYGMMEGESDLSRVYEGRREEKSHSMKPPHVFIPDKSL